MARFSCPVFTKNRLREEQEGKCAFCNIPTNAQILRNGDLVQLWEEFDHFVPVSYGGSNSLANWVLSCNVCNGIKSDRMFTNLRHARIVIEAERSQKGYEDAWAYHRRTILGITDETVTNRGESDTTPETDIYEQSRNPYEYTEPTSALDRPVRKPHIVPGSRSGSWYDASLYEDTDE